MKSLNTFTGLYPVSKTLRFELKPIGKDGNPLDEMQSANLLSDIRAKDKEIKDAYMALKPLLDKIHEEVINKSLTSEQARKIDFTNYYEKYKKKDKREAEEKLLRHEIVQSFNLGVLPIIQKAGTDKKGKDIFKKKDISCLKESGILKYIENNIDSFVNENLTKDTLLKHLDSFKGFFTRLSGYNQNRENYYAKDEKATAVATRIVHDNLPKFCDNCILFSQDKVTRRKKSDEIITIPSRKDEYLKAYQYLKDTNKTTQIKDAETGKMMEAYPIEEKMFEISMFSNCLSQIGIEDYNQVIGHYNLLINLYNQARNNESGFRKLEEFKTLYKQIGCGEKKALFFEIKYDTKKEQKEANEDFNKLLSLEELLQTISEAGKKYFEKTSNTDNDLTIYNLIDWLIGLEEWNGVYMSKAAVDIISNKYFANWHELKDRLKGNKACAYIDKNKELQINDAVEISGLLDVLDKEVNPGWSKVLFKESVLEERQLIINEKLLPSQNLIYLICDDIETLAKEFCNKSSDILKLTDFKSVENKLEIKKWLEIAKSLLRMVSYFDVKESKVKGNPIKSELSNMVRAILYPKDCMWFDWYDTIRNYLTKKPQDDAKKNKLKLNFENPILLGGWSDGQEKNKGAVILKNKDKYYLGILFKRSIFDTSKVNNPIYKSIDKNSGRLILRNLAFKTLAGKGFIRDFKEKYSDIGKRNPQDAIEKLQSFIKKDYVVKYPLLNQIVDKKYVDKKIFEKDLNEILLECYTCDFSPINWSLILQQADEKNIYLFEIYSKDFSEKSMGINKNLQTMYWHNIFDNNSSIQLCGGAELFFREQAIKVNDQVIHYANQPIYRRSDKKIESRFNHDIVKDRRFTVEKYFMHIPIKINYQAVDANRITQISFNNKINDYFSSINDIQILGIDRGEKHLVYYSLIDANGNIKDQNHFDIINEKDYLKEINEAAKKRKENRQNWQEIGNISNLKDGYISLVVHEIIEKMKDKDGNFKPTFIVLEDLNTGFKRSREKFEQQVYKKFELALAKKLNYLVDKKATMGEIGSVARALQLTPPVTNYQDIENKKQVGIMLYTRANYTSVTDPATGWRKTIYLKKGSEDNIKEQIINTFSEIGTESGDYYFQYTDVNSGKVWKLWSGKDGKSLDRFRYRRGKDKNEGIIESYNVKEMLDNLFVNFDKNKSLLVQLNTGIQLSKINENTAWESLRFLIDLIQQIRNSGDSAKGQDDNFLQSPVRNNEGIHFDSRLYEKDENALLPKDADANGAYNIARKGLIMYEHIKNVQAENIIRGSGSFPDLYISDKEWDLWLFDKKHWHNKLSEFAKTSK